MTTTLCTALEASIKNADALSRLPLSETIEDPPQIGCVLIFEVLPRPPLTADMVATAIQIDPTLSKLYKSLQEGSVEELKDNPETYGLELSPWFHHVGDHELSFKAYFVRNPRHSFKPDTEAWSQ